MTYRSQSRGFMYTAPPGPDGEDENRPTPTEEADDEQAAAAEPAPDLEPMGKTDANWTGNVSTDAPADD
ncbi:hypothetical protein NGM10_06245 [Halorussus salilacus]|uniref:hypothetical protein n=1 Tax=Halorussus salilacus TaxID=2953750 RepID=UPI0020A0A3FB|nr:hypothetical protein [Halorussus salilacus]USZ69334.1 hypothetical protein NGM10_06245 [Halorussus salilacus]